MPTPDFPGKPTKPGFINRVVGFVKSQVAQPKTVDLSGDSLAQLNTGVTTRRPREEINIILQGVQPEPSSLGPVQTLNYFRATGAAPDSATILPALPNKFYRIRYMFCCFVPNVAGGGSATFVMFNVGSGPNEVLALMGRQGHNPIPAIIQEESLPVNARIHEVIQTNGSLNVRIIYQIGKQ